MEFTSRLNEADYTPDVKIDAPVAELFLDPARTTELWPAEIAKDPLFMQQLELHQELSERLRHILNGIPQPTITLEDAVAGGYLTEQRVEDLYFDLADYLANEDYARLVLYLPFEFLPDQSWTPASEDLYRAIEEFRRAYLQAWSSLLEVYDVRANFVDGDVLEVEQRTTDLPRVVKAAHLIPTLVEKGMIEISDVVKIMESSSSVVLDVSITNTALIFDSMGLLSESDLNEMRQSWNYSVRNFAAIVDAEKQKDIPPQTDQIINYELIRRKLDAASSTLRATDFDGLTEKRKAWLRYKKMHEQVDLLAEALGGTIAKHELTEETIARILSDDSDNLPTQVLVGGIQKAIELVILENPERAKAIYDEYCGILGQLWQKNDPEIKDLLIKSFRRLCRLGVVDDDLLASLDISLPTLFGKLSDNLELIPEQMEEIKKIVNEVEADPELSSLIYPVLLVYGSRLKGYGDQRADVDVGVFVRPETALAERSRLRELLGGLLNNKDGAVEFWLDEDGEQLKIHDFDDYELMQAESRWTHVLMGAAWVGTEEVVNELRQKVIPGYFYETDKELYGCNVRKLWLEEIEHDTLQYRLMHKGYEKHYPRVGGINSSHAQDIDGKSMFYDSGYRQVATQLFIDKVFLPKLTKQ